MRMVVEKVAQIEFFFGEHSEVGRMEAVWRCSMRCYGADCEKCAKKWWMIQQDGLVEVLSWNGKNVKRR